MFSKQTFIEGVPVIPNGSILWGHLGLMMEPDFRISIHNFAVRHADEHGRCTFYMGPTTPSLSVLKPLDVQTLLKASSHRTIFPVMQQHVDRFLGKHNIGVLTGKKWKNQRAIIVKALHGRDFQQHNAQAIQVATQKLVKRLETESCTDNLLHVMRLLTLDIFGQSALHSDFDCCAALHETPPPRIMASFDFLATEMMRRMASDILNPASHMYSLPIAANKRHAAERAFIRSFIGSLVQERQRLMQQESVEAVPNDLLTSLIQNAQEQKDDNLLSEETLVDVLLSLLFAGFETTSVTLTYIFYMLSQHPHVEQECLAAIANAALRPDDCPYLNAVIKETMRLYPPAISTTRSLERQVVLGDSIVVPEGTYIYIPIWSIQRHAENFPDPLEFRPERWVEKQKGKWCEREYTGQDDAGNPNAFVAFSAGARSCAGQRFALQEMSIVLSTLLPEYHFEPPEDYVLTPHRDGIVQSPKGGIPMKIVKRK